MPIEKEEENNIDKIMWFYIFASLLGCGNASAQAKHGETRLHLPCATRAGLQGRADNTLLREWENAV